MRRSAFLIIALILFLLMSALPLFASPLPEGRMHREILIHVVSGPLSRPVEGVHVRLQTLYTDEDLVQTEKAATEAPVQEGTTNENGVVQLDGLFFWYRDMGTLVATVREDWHLTGSVELTKPGYRRVTRQLTRCRLRNRYWVSRDRLRITVRMRSE